MKIKFTDGNMSDLFKLATSALFTGETFITKMGQHLTVYNLLHTTTIGSLESLRDELDIRIKKLEKKDEWDSNKNSFEFSQAKSQRNLVNLVVGYKKYQQELEETKAEENRLLKEIAKIKESIKTPQEKLQDLEDQLAQLKQ